MPTQSRFLDKIESIGQRKKLVPAVCFSSTYKLIQPSEKEIGRTEVHDIAIFDNRNLKTA